MIVQVLVKPGSKVEKIVENADNLVVYLHARAHDGEANTSLIKVLAEYYGVSKGQVMILRGTKSKQKLVEIKK